MVTNFIDVGALVNLRPVKAYINALLLFFCVRDAESGDGTSPLCEGGQCLGGPAPTA